MSWYLLNNIVVVNGRGMLLRAGRPLDTPVPFVLAGAVLGTISAIRSNRRAQSLREGLQEVAGALGLAYEEGDVEVPPGVYPSKSLRGEWTRCQNRLSGSSDGVPVQMFDLTTISRSAENTTHGQWTVVVFEQTPLPAFACIPKRWSTIAERSLLPSISFDPDVGDPMARQAVADFQAAYQLSVPETAVGTDEDEVRRLFRAPRLEALARYPGWHVHSADGCLLLASNGNAPAAERAALWRDAIEIRRALLVPESSASLPIPAAPGMERDRQSRRSSGRAWGGIAGALVGFFGEFHCLRCRHVQPGTGGRPALSPLLSHHPGRRGGRAIAGSQLGGWLASRSYRPTRDGAPTPSVGKGWIFAARSRAGPSGSRSVWAWRWSSRGESRPNG